MALNDLVTLHDLTTIHDQVTLNCRVILKKNYDRRCDGAADGLVGDHLGGYGGGKGKSGITSLHLGIFEPPIQCCQILARFFLSYLGCHEKRAGQCLLRKNMAIPAAYWRKINTSWNFSEVVDGGPFIISRWHSRARICKCLWSPGIDSEEAIPPLYLARRAGTSNRVVVPARQAENRFLGSLKGLQIRAQRTFLPASNLWFGNNKR